MYCSKYLNRFIRFIINNNKKSIKILVTTLVDVIDKYAFDVMSHKYEPCLNQHSCIENIL